MKQIFTIILFVLTFQILVALNQMEITFNRKAIDFNVYSGPIFGYQDRIIVRNQASIEELQINDDSSLERISYFEMLRCAGSSPKALLDQDKYYTFYLKDGTFYMMVFDLSSKPMKHINTITIFQDFDNDFIISINVLENYIFLCRSERTIHGEIQKTFIFDKTTLKNVKEISERISYIAVKDSYIIGMALFGVFDGPYLVIFDYSKADVDNPWGPTVNCVFLNLQNHQDFRRLRVVNDLLFVTGDGYIGVFDISDILNVKNIITISESHQYIFYDALIINDTLIAFSVTGELFVYDIKNPNKPSVRDYDVFPINYYPSYPLYTYNGILFVMATDYIRTYGITGGLKLLSKYGTSRNPIDILHAFKGYYIDNQISNPYLKLQSLLDNKAESIIIDLSLENRYYSLVDFCFYENYLFISANLLTSSYFDIYDISNNNAVLINRIELPSGFISMFGNNIIISSYPNHNVWHFENNELNFLGSFIDNYEFSETANDYFFSLSDNIIQVRSKNDPLSIIKTQTAPISSEFIYQATQNTLFLRENHPSYDAFYSYTFDNDFNLTLVQEIVKDSKYLFHFKNGFLNFVPIEGTTSPKFYSIENGMLKKIAELNDNIWILSSVIFPKEKKLVMVGYSGIHVYDIEYDNTSEKDVLVQSNKSALLGNYPNPFNPETTIKFRIVDCHASLAMIEPPNPIPLSSGEGRGEGLTTVKIDIFNIKGQKVRSLVNGDYPSGEHSVIWNGTDDHNSPVTSGIYFYKITAGDFSTTKKMLLMK